MSLCYLSRALALYLVEECVNDFVNSSSRFEMNSRSLSIQEYTFCKYLHVLHAACNKIDYSSCCKRKPACMCIKRTDTSHTSFHTTCKYLVCALSVCDRAQIEMNTYPGER